MTWTDSAVLLSVAKSGKSKLALNVMTKAHGRVQCTTDLSPEDPLLLLPGCTLVLEKLSGSTGKNDNSKIHEATGGILTDDPNAESLVAIGALKELLHVNLPLNEAQPSVFVAAQELAESLACGDERWPMHYAYLEFIIADTMRMVEGIERCRWAHRHGDAIYFSPRTGRVATRTEVGAFLDKMISVPGFLMGNRNAKIADVRIALDLTRLLFTRFADKGVAPAGLPDIRDDLVDIIQEKKHIPSKKFMKSNVISDEDRKRLLLSMRGLQIPCRSNARAAG